MDRALNRKESRELMNLLGLPMSYYGHLPIMRKAFIQKSKEYHPDKGGDEDKCKKLTCLYRKLEDNIQKNKDYEDMWGNAGPSWRSNEVSNEEKIGRGQEFWKNFDLCVRGVNRRCPCFMCKLKRRHIWRLQETRKPNCWGKCYCYTCYCLWFGFEEKNPSSGLVWIGMISELTWGDIMVSNSIYIF
ncbi:small t [California sea lion polyomavirus 1]|uniref:Small t antigen n=2 Tax=California sea lion polyomavirus 1 TaxID=715223 RepID=D3IZT5_9POLY|nr:small t [California sea lion polyomavirus 1]ADC34412.1 small t [California sea lion polyomavirus 1]